jgi:hypothetical protein
MNQEQSKKYIEIVKSGKMDDMFDYGKEIGKLETASSPSTSFEDWEIGFEKLIRIEERNDCPPVPVINVAETRAFIKSLLTQSREQQKAEWIEKVKEMKIQPNLNGLPVMIQGDDIDGVYNKALDDIINLLTTPK